MAYLSAEDRRETIVEAAVDVIAKEGLARATTRRIAEQANAPLGSLHYCFKNKDELIQLVADRGSQMLEAAFDDVDPSHGFEATLRDSIAALWSWVEKNRGLQLALMELGLWRIRRGGPAKEVYGMWDRFGGDLMRERLHAAERADGAELAVPVDEIVRFVNHRFDGLAFEYGASQDPVACRRQTELLADAMVAIALPEQRRAKSSKRGSRARKRTTAQASRS